MVSHDAETIPELRESPVLADFHAIFPNAFQPAQARASPAIADKT
jgi:hypothetical protein